MKIIVLTDNVYLVQKLFHCNALLDHLYKSVSDQDILQLVVSHEVKHHLF